MSSLSLVGLAVVGKNNNPLYACDCERLLSDYKPPEKGDTDVFGIAESSRQGPQATSLAIPHQFLIHAALDRLDEIVHITTTGKSLPYRLSGMPVRRKPNPTLGPHWLGILLTVRDEWNVYGYISATNVKFFALTSTTTAIAKKQSESEGTPTLEQQEKVIQSFLERAHSLFIRYAMNSFAEIRDISTIESPSFDLGVRNSVLQYSKEMERSKLGELEDDKDNKETTK